MSIPDGAESMVDREVETLAERGVLTERQARVYVLRDVLGLSGEEVADRLGISPSTVSAHRSAARERIEAARRTVEEVRALGGPTVPDE
jgi:transcriptional regulator